MAEKASTNPGGFSELNLHIDENTDYDKMPVFWVELWAQLSKSSLITSTNFQRTLCVHSLHTQSHKDCELSTALRKHPVRSRARRNQSALCSPRGILLSDESLSTLLEHRATSLVSCTIIQTNDGRVGFWTVGKQTKQNNCFEQMFVFSEQKQNSRPNVFFFGRNNCSETTVWNRNNWSDSEYYNAA